MITTVNDYIGEKDSPFCTNGESSYKFPSKFLFEKMNLSWDGSFGYDVNGRKVIINGCNNAIYINKRFLIEFLEQNNLDVVWTVLGEKQKITGDLVRNFPGKSEFSYTYYLDNTFNICRNHEVFNSIKPQQY